ncbi:prepilin peptidase [Microvirga sp. CF3016]|uniref:prepilin peptidase n=1 Tax=Microvirga sp. CF3016 TaxID=3110181 RepID=UPI002E75D3B2|nr:A24 family peptidase [Microvirga sp. CF3016]MEE1611410.1 A24 family peptidase [Microvirga sp. CF3016]
MASSDIILWVAAAYLGSVSLAISVVDARWLIIPNALNAANAGGGLAFAALDGSTSLSASLIGSVLGFAMLLIFRASYRSIRGRDGLGLGDVKFMAGAGLWVGWHGLAPILFVSSLSALLFLGLCRVFSGRFDPQHELPFGPFLCIGTSTVWAVQVAGVAPWIYP